jgi:GntR family transcriptional regulator/MocR family aminotransferase
MRKIYGERRRILLDTLARTFDGEWRACGDDAGLHLAVEFPGLRFDDRFRKSGLEKGINITPVEYHCIEKGRHQDKLLIGYGHLEPDEIQSGVALLHGHMIEYFSV